MKGLSEAVEKLATSFDGFADQLREFADDLPENDGRVAGDGEYRDDVVAKPYLVPRVEAPEHNDIEDEKIIQMKSGDLRKVVNAYRKFVRFAREGHIPDQNERFELHGAVRAVKHLIRKPRR